MRRTIVAAVIVAASVAPAVAGEPPLPPSEYQPPVFSRPTIGLLEAVELTLAHDPAILLQRETVRQRRGVAQQAAGLFDLTLLGEFSYEFVQSELGSRERDAMQKKRDDIRKDLERTEDRLRDLQERLDEILANRQALLEGREPPIRFDDPLLEAQFRLLYQRYLDAPPEQKQQILNDLLAVLRSKELQVRADMADYLAEAEEAREKLRMLGTVPRIQRSYEGSLSLQLTKLYRNGMSLAPFIDLSGGGLSYQGKPKDEEFGGPGVKDSYDARLGFSVGIPLGRGRGFASAGAAEQSAILDVAASIDALTHAASASVLNTALAYWDALAAQQTLAVHSKSLELQMQLKELAELLIQADELPRIELVRVQARQAEVQALMEGARRTAHEARLALARTMGLEVRTTADAPAPSDDFPPVPAKVELACANAAELAAASLERRLDYRAAVRLQESGKVLWRAAAIDLAPRADLNFSTWYGSLAEDSDVLEGLKGVVTGRWAGPSARIGLTYERPYENNTQKGKLEQAAAAFRQRAISARDLERAIKAGVVRELASLREAARQLARIQEAVELHRQAVDNEMEKLRMGTATVIDTILTEQRYVDAQLQLIAARQQVARLLARLRYETGTLITTGDAGAFVSRDDLVALPPLAQ